MVGVECLVLLALVKGVAGLVLGQIALGGGAFGQQQAVVFQFDVMVDKAFHFHLNNRLPVGEGTGIDQERNSELSKKARKVVEKKK